MSEKDNFKTFYALSIAWQLGFLIVAPILGFLLVGFWLDKLFNTKPIFMVIGLFVGVVVTIHEVHNLLKPFTKSQKRNNEH